LGKQTNNNDQVASVVPHVAKLKIIVAQRKTILEFVIILVKQCKKRNGKNISKI